MDITTTKYNWAKDVCYDPPEQNHFNISVSLSKYDSCAVFYMASVNSRSPLRAGALHIFLLWGTSFMHALFTYRDPKTRTSANYTNTESRASSRFQNCILTGNNSCSVQGTRPSTDCPWHSFIPHWHIFGSRQRVCIWNYLFMVWYHGELSIKQWDRFHFHCFISSWNKSTQESLRTNHLRMSQTR